LTKLQFAYTIIVTAMDIFYQIYDNLSIKAEDYFVNLIGG